LMMLLIREFEKWDICCVELEQAEVEEEGAGASDGRRPAKPPSGQGSFFFIRENFICPGR